MLNGNAGPAPGWQPHPLQPEEKGELVPGCQNQTQRDGHDGPHILRGGACIESVSKLAKIKNSWQWPKME